MLAYRLLRRVALSLRTVQTVMQGAAFLASDYAYQNGERAKAAGKASIDKKINGGRKVVEGLFDQADVAMGRAMDAQEELHYAEADLMEARTLLDREVL